jgi:aminoglycoside phosphotransferase (APT) family kinase protein
VLLDTTSAPVVRALLAASLPDLPTKRLRLVVSGEEFDTWEADGAVVKVPKTAESAAKLDTEVGISGLLSERLGPLVPAVRAVGTAADAFPYCSVAFDRARGRPGQTVEGQMVRPKPWARASLARDVATAFSTLHSTPVRRAKADGAAKRPLDVDAMMDIDQAAIARASKIAGDAVDRFLVDPIPAEARTGGALALCHGDVKGEHLYVSEDGGRLTAIVDWADVAITDPAVDLAGLVLWLGESFLDAVLGLYTGPADEGTRARALFVARAGLLGYLQLHIAGEVSAPRALLDAQLRAAFE